MHPDIRVAPLGLTINDSNVVLLTDLGGAIDGQQHQGLLANDTRFISGYHLSINARPWTLQNSATPANNVARCFLTNPTLEQAHSGQRLPSQTLQLVLLRWLDDGLLESFELTSYAPDRVSVLLEISVESDFADLFEIRRHQPRPRTGVETHWSVARRELVNSYRHRDYFASLSYAVASCDSEPVYANGRIAFQIDLAAHQSWRAETRARLRQNDRFWHAGGAAPSWRARNQESDGARQRWLASCTQVDAANTSLQHAVKRATEDLAALRLGEQGADREEWFAAAGLPWYLALFGRDSIVAGLQTLMLHPGFTTGALRALARYQAQSEDDWLDAQPGKIPHELRQGELAYFNCIPKTPGYQSWDSTPLYLILLHHAWRWLGDRELIEDLRPTMEACLKWIDESGDIDGDGFQEYQCRSSYFRENMSWKDADNAIVYDDGTQVRQPKGTCELQAYVYAAKCGAAEILRDLGEPSRAEALEAQAADLKLRFNADFWMPEQQTYALGLDAYKRQIKSVASNAGLCLWTGIIDRDKAPAVIERLLQPDMFSGWGMRTLSANSPAYNPLDYQLGAVWPVDNSLCAAGMKRYGFEAEAQSLIGAMLDGASRFEAYRLPEVLLGHQRHGESFPVEYIGANSPQAWSSGAMIYFLQTLLGLSPQASKRRLYVDPNLPPWASYVKVHNLRVGASRLELHFWREASTTNFYARTTIGDEIAVIKRPMADA